MITRSKTLKNKKQEGFSLPEMLVVLLIISIMVVLALPQINASRRMFRFSGMQRQVGASLNDARQEAMSQRVAVTFRYDNVNKKIIIYGGSFGAVGDSKNKIAEMFGGGLIAADISYGRPGGAPNSALTDTCNLTAPIGGMVDITFQADGSVVDGANNPVNNALFFYNNKYPQESAFATSVLGAGGRVKTWRYSKAITTYVE